MLKLFITSEKQKVMQNFMSATERRGNYFEICLRESLGMPVIE